ncbi:hypothetical protein PV08_05154 [Exophiala spinifera]|uniref:Alpha/beta hydrolase fold-3 domain-containing protein n=1 Tax=Exophiala spinifera TaxID=91928 RepID=A0A0D2C2X7_9EURO|nr:uncharacterized protein PV08_05154 [Exophiala spinifera]KIW17959.1 hypothetical protein PV08_05154 [Exophiala spinifera]
MALIRSEAHKMRNDQFRTMFESVEAAKAFIPPTAATVKARAGALGVPHNVTVIPNGKGAKLHYLGVPNANKLILYFHGGGFALPPTEGHVTFMLQCADKIAQSSGQRVQIAFLEYTLSHVERYPLQLLQATEALRLILDSGTRPSDIVVAGDSAGGNMCLGIVSHILHPLEGIPPLGLREPLAGVLLISPWVSFDEDASSYKENVNLDICSPELLHAMADAYVPAVRNNWTDPYLAESFWWKGFPAKEVLNLCGGHELLKDYVLSVGRALSQAGVDIKTVECPLHVHVECILDAQVGLSTGEMAEEIWAWLPQAFQ